RCLYIAYLRNVGANRDAVGLQKQLCNGPGCHPRGSLPRRTSSAPTVVAHAVFGLVGKIGMGRTKAVGNVTIVFASLVSVFDDKGDRLPGSNPFKYTAKYLHRIVFLSLGRNLRLPWLASGQLSLNEGLINGQTCRAAIKNNPDCRSVRLAEGGNAKYLSERVCHDGIESPILDEKAAN